MSSRPEAIDSRLVFHVYSAAALPLGIVSYMWPLLLPESFPTQEAIVRVRVAAAVLTALGTCGAAFRQIDDPIGRRRGLIGFAHAHVMLGAMLLIQALTAWTPEPGDGPGLERPHCRRRAAVSRYHRPRRGFHAGIAAARHGSAGTLARVRGPQQRRGQAALGVRAADPPGGAAGGARAAGARSARRGQAAAVRDPDRRRDRAGTVRQRSAGRARRDRPGARARRARR